jgi:hypothetical protein
MSRASSKFFIVLFFAAFGHLAYGDNADVRELESLVQSPDWSCKYTHKVNLAHMSDGSIDRDRTLTLASVRCDGTGVKNGSWKTYVLGCKAPGRDETFTLKKCIKNSLLETGEIRWSEAVLSNISKRVGSDKYGRTCKYISKTPMVVSKIKSSGRWDNLCATPIACDRFDSGPKHFVVACDALSLTKVKGSELAVCPQVNDCVDNELPLSAAFSEEELAQLQQRARLTSSDPSHKR